LPPNVLGADQLAVGTCRSARWARSAHCRPRWREPRRLRASTNVRIGGSSLRISSRRSVEDDLAVVEEGDVVRQPLRAGHVVADDRHVIWYCSLASTIISSTFSIMIGSRPWSARRTARPGFATSARASPTRFFMRRTARSAAARPAGEPEDAGQLVRHAMTSRRRIREFSRSVNPTFSSTSARRTARSSGQHPHPLAQAR